MTEAPSIRLDGKVAVVTGGGAGIGRAIVEAYAALGARTATIEIDPARAADLREVLGPEHVVVEGDVRSAETIARAFTEVERRFGALDVLVNNVGDSLRLRGSFADRSEEDWDALYAINLKHIFACTKAALPLIRAGGRGGSIINLSTIEAYRGAPPAAIYAAFKAAITGFTRSIALELGPENIRVNIIAPETTETAQVPVSQMIAPEHRDHIERWIPMGRFGEARDAAGCAVFLASDLSAWVTGTTIHVDGGALAAAGFYRTPTGEWTNFPVVSDVGIGWRPAST
ncbi:SDR family NAD(P)-dependent oxidoreductase [Sphingomonas sp. ID0503]|uniref:SDR family NAD(P)-dependent oxidoreductase n=1 Tax=Sphingomonas sp. ID0503 TaxID=3399691 RepID=UPI003AFB79FB